MKHSFHPEAVEEYLGAVSYYAAISPPLAESFIRAIEEASKKSLCSLKLGRLSRKTCVCGTPLSYYSVFHMT